MINKLLYRSRQRGFLELDLLVGLWAEQEVPKMDTHMLQQFTVVLDQVNSSHKHPAASRKETRPLLPKGAPLTDMHATLLQENPDLFKWLTGQQEPPGEMQGNQAFKVRQGPPQQHAHAAVCPASGWLLSQHTSTVAC
jgi:succinate dehydrogenase flavin-adding protein (antitoxin of CptAB toxin-antitoxin module)